MVVGAQAYFSRHPAPTNPRDLLDANMRLYGAKAYFPFRDPRQGIVHVIGPENGATLPGMTVVCGDSHTSTHGAFGCLAFGIGTTEVEHVLARSAPPAAAATRSSSAARRSKPCRWKGG